MTDGDALLAAILAQPDEDTPRLMFADWLDAEGRGELAEFIRTQVALARLPEPELVPWNPRAVALWATEKAVLARWTKTWLAPLRHAVAHAEFRRGFAEVVWMSATEFLDHGEDLFRLAPVRELRLMYSTHPAFGDLLESPLLPRLDTLDVSSRTPGDDTIARLVRSRAAGKLKGLRVRAAEVTDAGAFRLADCDSDWRPREIDVSFNPIGPAGRAALRNRYGAGAVRFDTTGTVSSI